MKHFSFNPAVTCLDLLDAGFGVVGGGGVARSIWLKLFGQSN